MSSDRRTAVSHVVANAYIYVQHVINQLHTGNFAVYRLDSGSSADQFRNLVTVQLPAYKRFKWYDFALSEPPSLRYAAQRYFHALPLQ